MTVVAVIPARGGSKGLPRKNLRLLAGVPLIVHAVRQAKAARSVDRVIVTTDDEEIASVAREVGAEVPFIRPAKFATDTATDLDVFRHLLGYLRDHEGVLPDILVQVRTTSPVRRPAVIDLAIAKLRACPEADSVRSVSLAKETPYKMWYVGADGAAAPVIREHALRDWYDQPRQTLPDVFVQDGMVDVLRPTTVLDKDSMAGDVVLGLLHPEVAVDIDDLSALLRAEEALSRASRGDPSPPIGILQGRLTPSWNGELQCHPRDKWAQEFDSAASIGLDHIELLLERDPDPDNPLLSPAGRAALRRESERTGVATSTASIDFVLDHDLAESATVEYLCSLAPALSEVGCSIAVLPMFEASAGIGIDPTGYVRQLRRVADVYRRHGVRVCVESLLPADKVYELLGRVAHDNVGICYDVGNATAAGYDTVAEARLLGPAIQHVHVKDKTQNGANVRLGTGVAAIADTLAELVGQGCRCAFTLETPRGDDPIAAAARQTAFTRSSFGRIREETYS
ncbi:TIM barrel protein [Nonomuraea sp. NPDC049625]|uniref:TIM barrel protein n=1 Tax=Nonomuraea sp. NPDC049625 TaxID=3155775 RepID=UPI003423A1D2